MAFTFEVHKDGTSRTQVLLREYNQRWCDLKKELENFTCNGVPLTISLNSLGEPVICSSNKDGCD
ncbi:Carbamoyltransferase C-terminus [Atopomonas hussainii]|uniref:Carbamoyltransferase C-terminus n=2 Tax=Atopomonas hussainii TaxID=1429083 RepID=A0A1H7HIC0_9GAMM|nr:Carbamoyltransferase C-terminus [Atopomonas hussainii]